MKNSQFLETNEKQATRFISQGSYKSFQKCDFNQNKSFRENIVYNQPSVLWVCCWIIYKIQKLYTLTFHVLLSLNG